MQLVEQNRVIVAWQNLRHKAEELVNKIERNALDANDDIAGAHNRARGARELFRSLDLMAQEAKDSVNAYGNQRTTD